MILEMKVPSPGESISEVEISQWLVSEGDFVKKDQIIAEVDSDKATLDLPAEETGVISLKAEEGDTIAVGQVVCHIDTSKKENATAKNETKQIAKPKPEKTEKNIIQNSDSNAVNIPSPAARKLMSEKNITSSTILGTGKSGRITKQDILKAVASMGTSTKNRNTTKNKLSLLRRKVAERLVSVKNETAMLTTFNEVDMSQVFSLRTEHKEIFEKKHGVGLGFMSFFTKATVKALELFPDVNSMIDGDYKISYDYKDISIAVSSPKGLMVPVIRNAETLTFSGIEKEVKRLATKARDNEITVDDMTGGTFTITNGGVFGSMLSTPIINPPQSAILGMHNIVKRPIVVNNKIEIRPIMYLALSYDHRIIDGKESVSFLVELKNAIENPKELLMESNIKSALEL